MKVVNLADYRQARQVEKVVEMPKLETMDLVRLMWHGLKQGDDRLAAKAMDALYQHHRFDHTYPERFAEVPQELFDAYHSAPITRLMDWLEKWNP